MKKLTKKQTKAARELRAEGRSDEVIADRLGVTAAQVAEALAAPTIAHEQPKETIGPCQGALVATQYLIAGTGRGRDIAGGVDRRRI